MQCTRPVVSVCVCACVVDIGLKSVAGVTIAGNFCGLTVSKVHLCCYSRPMKTPETAKGTKKCVRARARAGNYTESAM